jgi:hypothetical protein
MVGCRILGACEDIEPNRQARLEPSGDVNTLLAAFYFLAIRLRLFERKLEYYHHDYAALPREMQGKMG